MLFRGLFYLNVHAAKHFTFTENETLAEKVSHGEISHSSIFSSSNNTFPRSFRASLYVLCPHGQNIQKVDASILSTLIE